MTNPPHQLPIPIISNSPSSSPLSTPNYPRKKKTQTRQNTMFDPNPVLQNLHIHTSNDRWAGTSIESRVRKASDNYQSRRSSRREEENTEDDSGFSSPPLWETTAKTDYKYLSPNSRSQAIARGQWELMEMVKAMPESSYELSLKDLVQLPVRAQNDAEEDCLVDGKVLARKASGRVRREKMGRSRSGETNNNGGGVVLKMAFPFSSFGSKKKKKSLVGMNSFSKVSPRPEGVERSGGKAGEKEWWKKRFSSESGSSGGSSSSSSCRKKGGCSPGCWSFLTKKSMKTSK